MNTIYLVFLGLYLIGLTTRTSNVPALLPEDMVFISSPALILLPLSRRLLVSPGYGLNTEGGV